MVVHLVWMINKSGQLIYHKYFTAQYREAFSKSDKALTVAGVVYSIHGIAKETSPVPGCTGINLIESSDFNMFVFESPTTTKIILLTDVATTNVDPVVNGIYRAYADYALKNPFYVMEQPVRLDGFSHQIDAIVHEHNFNVGSRR